MTKSRDNAKSTAFPGEIRAGELAKIREEIAEFVQPDDAVVFCGDWGKRRSCRIPLDTPYIGSYSLGRTTERGGRGAGGRPPVERATREITGARESRHAFAR